MWDSLLNYTPAQAFFWERAPPRTEYAAAFANVILIGLVFFLLIRLARRIAARYGTAGFVFASLLLILITLPAGKSLARLIMSRSTGWDLKLVMGMLALLPAAAAVLARRRFLALASTVLVTLSPLILIEAVLSISRCSTDRSADYAERPLAPLLPRTQLPRIVWIVFDELDYRLSFPDRPSDVPMPSFDRLRKESLFAENALPPAPDTIPSVPSLLAGKSLVLSEGPGSAPALLERIATGGQPNIFASVHRRGANAAVVGWYLPYCRLFSQDLAACSFHEMENALSRPASTFQESLIIQQQSLFAYGHRSLLGTSPRSKQRIDMLNSMHESALRDVANPALNLILLHFPVPHAPYLYDPFSHTFPKRYLGVGSYFDGLVLADVYLSDLRQAMTGAGLWDTTTVLVTSDHSDRTSMSVDGKKDPRVPFLLKMAGQSKGQEYTYLLPTVVTKPLLEAILDRKIATSEDAVNWLNSHSK